jgi:tetratricopeptide (TPR) repeat protein
MDDVPKMPNSGIVEKVNEVIKDFNDKKEETAKATNEIFEIIHGLLPIEQYATINNIALTVFQMGKFNLSASLFEKSYEISLGMKNDKLQAHSLLGATNSYFFLNNDKMILKNCIKTLEINKRIKDKSIEATCYGEMGHAFEELEDYENAKKFLLMALQIDVQVGNAFGAEASLGNLGNVFNKLGQYEQAIICYENVKKALCRDSNH